MKKHVMKQNLAPNELERFVKCSDEDLERSIRSALSVLINEPHLRFFGLTGPTCSGKTTAASMITEELEKMGYTVHIISLDDFFYDVDHLHALADAADIEIDYDSEDTIDIALFKEQVTHLIKGEEAHIPHFDFESGRRKGEACIRPTDKDLFLFEGIQILYPCVREILLRDQHYKSILICPLSSIEVGGVVFEPNEIRLCRRLVRDYRHRAAEPAFTLFLWESVRANEEKNIFPNLHLCNPSIDSTIPYEMGMLKPYLLPLLEAIPTDHEDYHVIAPLLQKLKHIEVVPSSYMTENSLYKEFI